MSNDQNIRWHQRFANYKKAFEKLDEAVVYVQEKNKLQDDAGFDIDILKEGVIQRFEYTHELAWKVIKDFFKEAGNETIYGSKDATRQAFKEGLITDGDVWMEMIQSGNRTSHTYNEEIADEIYSKILTIYHPAFKQFVVSMETLKGQS